jgi:hypothetical protein
MRPMSFAAVVLGVAVSAGSLVAQTIGQDMKAAGHDTVHATKKTGHVIAKGTETGYDKTKEGTVKAAHATAHGTKVAAKDTAHGTEKGYGKTKEGTEKAAHATAHGTRVAAHKTANGTERAADKVDGK